MCQLVWSFTHFFVVIQYRPAPYLRSKINDVNGYHANSHTQSVSQRDVGTDCSITDDYGLRGHFVGCGEAVRV